MDSSPSGSIILILILIAINAFFAAAEMAIVSINKTRINILAEEGNKKAQLLLELLKEPSNFLATIQVGITFAGFFASASAATGLSGDLAKVLTGLGVPYGENIALVAVTIFLSYLTLVLGELFPKRVALQKSEAVAMFAVKPVVYLSKITKPFVKLLSGSTNFLVKITGTHSEDLEEKVSKEEIRSIVEVGKEHGVINETERDMIESIIAFDDKLAKEVMTPRTEVFMLNVKDKISDKIDAILEENFSRIPVYEEEVDNIVGVLYMKDLFSEIVVKGIDNVQIKELVKNPYFVPETKNIDVLFKELQLTKNHMAILIDEYGGFSGIATIEDLIEEVVGEICDEHDKEDHNIERLSDNSYIVDGLLTIDDVNDALNLELQSESSDTIGGLLIELLGVIPKAKEEASVKYRNMILQIEELDEKRIDKIRISIEA